jgi:hypothetical protein
MNQEPINNKIVYWKFTKFIITNELVQSALSRTIKNKKFLLLAFALQLRHRPPTTTLRTTMSSTTSSSRETKYKLPDYSELTLQELLTACQQRRPGNVGHKHELIRRLVNDDLDAMQRHLLNKEWNPTCPPFLAEAAEIREAYRNGAYQFYVTKVEYLRERMREKEGC